MWSHIQFLTGAACKMIFEPCTIFIKGQTNDRNWVCIITFRSVSPGQWRSAREPGGEQDQDTGIIFFFSTSLTYRAHHHPFQSLLSGSMKKEIVVSQYSRVESLVENNFRTQVLYSCFLHICILLQTILWAVNPIFVIQPHFLWNDIASEKSPPKPP